MRTTLTCAFALLAFSAAACSSGSFPVGRDGQSGGAISIGNACTSANGAHCASGSHCRFANGTCGAQNAAGTCQAVPQGCTEEYAPVCGCDGKTYGNECAARAAAVSVAAVGICPTAACVAGGNGPTCTRGSFCEAPTGTCVGPNGQTVPGTCVAMPQACTTEYAPVCGCDGKTYSNACEAEAAGMSVAQTGACVGSAVDGGTADTGAPIETDGSPGTGTPCTANGAICGAAEYCSFASGGCAVPGTCLPRPNGCTTDWVPVCGCDGKTYGNQCTANSLGQTVAHAGTCP